MIPNYKKTLRELLRTPSKPVKEPQQFTNAEILAEAKQIAEHALKRGWIKYGIELTEGQVDNIARRK